MAKFQKTQHGPVGNNRVFRHTSREVRDQDTGELYGWLVHDEQQQGPNLTYKGRPLEISVPAHENPRDFEDYIALQLGWAWMSHGLGEPEVAVLTVRRPQAKLLRLYKSFVRFTPRDNQQDANAG